jgi:hypothetical protein
MSDGPLARVGISISVTWPSGVMRASLFAPCSVAHTVPRASTATPYGLGRRDASPCGVEDPLRSRVTLSAVLSAKPHGAVRGEREPVEPRDGCGPARERVTVRPARCGKSPARRSP